MLNFENLSRKILAKGIRAYSRKWGHEFSFSENGQRNVEKGQNTWKFGQKIYKIWKYFEKAQVIACDNCTE